MMPCFILASLTFLASCSVDKVETEEDLPVVHKKDYYGLIWLKNNQNQDGSWGDKKDDANLLSFCLLAYYGYGYTPSSAEFGHTVLKALKKAHEISENQKNPNPLLAMAMAQSYALTRIPLLKVAMEKDVQKILSRQNPDGSFMYDKENDILI